MDPNSPTDEVVRAALGSDEVADALNLQLRTADRIAEVADQEHFNRITKATVFFIRSPRLAYGHFLD